MLGDRLARLVLGLPGAGAEVRRDHHRRQAEQRRVGRRLPGEDVEGGAGHPTLPDGLGQRLLVHDAAPGDVDDAQLGLGPGQQLLADQAHRLGRLGQVHGEEVGLGHDPVEGQQLDGHLAGRDPARRTGRRRRSASRTPGPAGRPACRSGPSPTTPRVLLASSTPSHRDRSHRPAVRAAWAWGTLRAWARSNAMVCSAAEIMFDCGAFTTITPRRVAASTSTLSRPMPARPTTTRSLAGREHLGRHLGGGADDEGVGALDRRRADRRGTGRAARPPRSRCRAGRPRPRSAISSVTRTRATVAIFNPAAPTGA